MQEIQKTSNPFTCSEVNIVLLLLLLFSSKSVFADISGKVFRDFNANGTLDTSASFNEVGMADVTVTAYDTNGATFAAVTDSTGSYAVNASAGTAPFRLEFTTLPSGYYPSSSSDGATGTTVQFVPDGNASNVNLGINAPEDYSQANPKMAIPVYKPGNSGASALQTFTYDAPKTGDTSGLPEALSAGSGVESPTSLATPAEIGTVWGLAHQRTQKRFFATTFLRRHAAMANGAGVVYIVDPVTGVKGKFNLEGVTPSNVANPIAVGTVTRTSSGLTTDDNDVSAQLNRDLDAFAKVGKMSFGDADIDGTGNTLWVVNLFEKTLLAVDVSGTTATLNNASASALKPLVREYSIQTMANAPTCTKGQIRPWGLSFYRNQGYLGVVCDASAAGATAADLDAYVLRFDPANPSAGFAATPALTFGLDYNRELAAAFSKEAYFGAWKPWTDSWDTISTETSAFLDSTTPPTPVKPQVNHHMPLVSSIEFTDDGSMVIALLDRNGYMLGRRNMAPYSGSPSGPINALIEHMSSGDIIHACHINGSFVLEGTGGCTVHDDGTGTTVQETFTPPRPKNVVNDGASGSGEFYYQDAYALGAGHNEIGMGALAVQPGRNEVVATVYDPLGFNDPAVATNTYGLNVNGLHYYNSTQGNFNNGYLLLKNDESISKPINPSADNWIFGKANALGDIELLTDPAPIEIGNRVWLDADNDGIQDAGENGIPNVQVELRSGASVLATATTAADGTYYFSNATGATTASKKYGLTQLQPNAVYTVKFPTTVSVSGTTYNLTTATAGSNTLIDSNAPATGEVTVGATDIPSAGANNHSFDVGYSSLKTDLVLTKTANPTTVKSGDTVTYTLTLRNESNTDATGVQVTDNLPSSLELVNATPQQGTFVNGVWDVGTVKARTTLTLALETRVK